MVNKKILVLVSLLVVIAVAFILMDNKSGSPKDDRVGSHLLMFEKLAEVKGIEISKESSKISIQMGEKSRWIVDGGSSFPASAEVVVRFLEDVSAAKIIRLVSTKKDKWGDLELTKGNKVVLFKEGQKPLLSLIIGKDRKGNGQYIAFEGGDSSYLIDKSLQLESDSDRWELKTLANIKKSRVKSVIFKPLKAAKKLADVTIQRDKKEAKFEVVGKGEKEKETKLDTAASILDGLTYTKKFPKESIDGGLFEKANRVSVELFDGKKYSVMVAVKEELKKAKDKKQEKEKIYYVSMALSGGDSATSEEGKFFNNLMQKWVFQLEEYQAEKFLKGRNDFIEKL